MEDSQKSLTETCHLSQESKGEEVWKAGAVNNGRWRNSHGRAHTLRLIRRSEKIYKPH